jgi:drug/metabolite transporter superfamily protein YnfA
MGKFSLAAEVWMFLRQNKKLWLLPIVVVLLLLGALLVFAQSSALAPFIYTIF